MDRRIPNKLFFKIGEVCEITDTQPYVLRYWESEFKLLRPKKNPAGQRVYRQRDLDLVRRIKTLLYDERLTLEVTETAIARTTASSLPPARRTSRKLTASSCPRQACRSPDAVRRNRLQSSQKCSVIAEMMPTSWPVAATRQ